MLILTIVEVVGFVLVGGFGLVLVVGFVLDVSVGFGLLVAQGCSMLEHRMNGLQISAYFSVLYACAESGHEATALSETSGPCRGSWIGRSSDRAC